MEELSDDAQLLRRFAAVRDEAAFAAIVRRYLNLVYSSAVRRVGNRDAADDVAQAVFVILARKAKSVPASAPLSAWLLKVVAYCSANALRVQARRRRHERAAAERVNRTAGASPNPSDVLVWQEVARELDDAVLRLPPRDRRVVLLRYYEDRPIRDVAAALNVSEAAAKQRVSRALARLRGRLDRQGTPGVITTAALGMLITANLTIAAPASLIARAGDLAGNAGASAATLSIAKGAMTMMTLAKTKLAVAVLAGLLLIGAGGVWTMTGALAAGEAPAVAASNPTATKPADQDAPAAKLEIGRKVEVTLGDLVGPGVESTKSTMIDGAGNISLPLIGKIKVADLTVAQAEQAIVEAYAKINVPGKSGPAKITAKIEVTAAQAAAGINQTNNAGVTVANAPPVIIKTVPVAGATDVDANLTEIKITFSKDMRDGSWSWAQMSDDTFPKTTGQPHYEADRRTCVLPVKLEAGKTYILLLNKPPFTNFVDTDRRQGIEYWLVFQTKP